MPTYEYACAKCGRRFDVYQSFSDEPLRKHEACGGKLTKVFGPVGIVLKGSGFYKTDNRASSSAKAAKAESGASDGSADGAASDSSGSDSSGSSTGTGSDSAKQADPAKKPDTRKSDTTQADPRKSASKSTPGKAKSA